MVGIPGINAGRNFQGGELLRTPQITPPYIIICSLHEQEIHRVSFKTIPCNWLTS